MRKKKSVKTNTISYQLDDAEWETAVKMVVMHTMLALYRTGYREINLGGLMLLMGFESAIAKDHITTFVKLDENFEDYVNQFSAQANFESPGVPKDTVWH